MKKIAFGFVLGLTLVVVLFKLIERNHEQILEIVKSIPNKWDSESLRKTIFNKNDSSDEDHMAA